MYYYSTNVQGDVVSILNSAGNPVDGYTYDARGNQSTDSGTSTIGTLNPLRYRGYVYDTETGLYYLQSRYYDPWMRRFFNADLFAATGQGFVGNNMFAYCNNNPVNGADPCGTCFHRWDFWNDCEKCGGQTIEQKFDYAVTVAKTWTNDALSSTKQVVNDVTNWISPQITPIIESGKEFIKHVSDPIVKGVQMAADFVFDRFSTPEKASNTLSAIGYTLDAAAAYCGGVAGGLSIPTFGMSIPTAGMAAAILVIASLPFYGAALAIDIFNEE